MFIFAPFFNFHFLKSIYVGNAGLLNLEYSNVYGSSLVVNGSITCTLCLIELEKFALYGSSVFQEISFGLGIGQPALILEGDIDFDGKVYFPTNVVIGENSSLKIEETCEVENGVNITNYGTFISDASFHITYMSNFNNATFNKAITISRNLVNYGTIVVNEELSISTSFKSYNGTFEGTSTIFCHNCVEIEVYGFVETSMAIGNLSNSYQTTIKGDGILSGNYSIAHSELSGSFYFGAGSKVELNGVYLTNARLSSKGNVVYHKGSFSDSTLSSDNTIELLGDFDCDSKSLINASGNVIFTNSTSNCNHIIQGELTLANTILQGSDKVRGTTHSVGSEVGGNMNYYGSIIGNITVGPGGKLSCGNVSVKGTLSSYGTISGNVSADAFYSYDSTIKDSNVTLSEGHFRGDTTVDDAVIFLKKATMCNGSVTGSLGSIEFVECSIDNFEVSVSLVCRNCFINVSNKVAFSSENKKVFENSNISMTKYSFLNVTHGSFTNTCTGAEGTLVISGKAVMDNFTINSIGYFSGASIGFSSINLNNDFYLSNVTLEGEPQGKINTDELHNYFINGTFVMKNTIFTLNGITSFDPSYTFFENSHLENWNLLYASQSDQKDRMDYEIKNYDYAFIDGCAFEAFHNYGKAKISGATTITSFYNSLQCTLESRLTVDILVLESTSVISGDGSVVVVKTGEIKGEVKTDFLLIDAEATIFDNALNVNNFSAVNSSLRSSHETITSLHTTTLINSTLSQIKELVNKGDLNINLCVLNLAVNNENTLLLCNSSVLSLTNDNNLTFTGNAVFSNLSNKGVMHINSFTVNVTEKFESKKGINGTGHFFIEKGACFYPSDYVSPEVTLEGKMFLRSDCAADKIYMLNGASISGSNKLTLNEASMTGSVEINADLRVLRLFCGEGSVIFQGNTFTADMGSVSLFKSNSLLSGVRVINNGKMTLLSVTANNSSFYNYGHMSFYNSSISGFFNWNETEFFGEPATHVANMTSEGQLYGNGTCVIHGGILSGISNVSLMLQNNVTCKNVIFMKKVSLESAHVYGTSEVHNAVTVHDSMLLDGKMNFLHDDFLPSSLNCKNFTFSFHLSVNLSSKSFCGCGLIFLANASVNESRFSYSDVQCDGTMNFSSTLFEKTPLRVNGSAFFTSSIFDGYVLGHDRAASSLTTANIVGTAKISFSTFNNSEIYPNNKIDLEFNTFNGSILHFDDSKAVVSNVFLDSTVYTSNITNLRYNLFERSTVNANGVTEFNLNVFNESLVYASGSTRFVSSTFDSYLIYISNTSKETFRLSSSSAVYANGTVEFVSDIFRNSTVHNNNNITRFINSSFENSSVYANGAIDFTFSSFKNRCDLYFYNNASLNETTIFDSTIYSSEPLYLFGGSVNDSIIYTNVTTYLTSSLLDKSIIYGRGIIKLLGSFTSSEIYAFGSIEFSHSSFDKSFIYTSGTTSFVSCTFNGHTIHTNNSTNSISKPVEIHTDGPVEFISSLFYMSTVHAASLTNLVSNSFDSSSVYDDGAAFNSNNSFYRSNLYTSNATDVIYGSFETSYIEANGETEFVSCTLQRSEMRSNGTMKLNSSSFTGSNIENSAYLLIDEHSYFNYMSLSQLNSGCLHLEDANMSGIFELDINGSIEGKGHIFNERYESVPLSNALVNGSSPGFLKTRNHLTTKDVIIGIYGLRRYEDFFVLESDNFITFFNVSIFFYYNPSIGDKYEIAFYDGYKNQNATISFYNIDPSIVSYNFYEKNLTIQIVGCQSGGINISDCSICDKGHYYSGSACVPCPRGFFGNLTGASVCMKCPDGYYSGDFGSIQCKMCGNGNITDGIHCINTTIQDSGSSESSSSTTKVYSSESSLDKPTSSSTPLSFSLSTSSSKTSSVISISSSSSSEPTSKGHISETSSESNQNSLSSLIDSEESESSSDALLTYTSTEKDPTMNWFFPLALLLGLGLFICMMKRRKKKEDKIKIFRLCKESADGECEIDTQPLIMKSLFSHMKKIHENNVTLGNYSFIHYCFIYFYLFL